MSTVPRKQTSRRLWYYGLTSLIGMVLVGGANPPGAAPPPAGQQAAPAASPLDEPLRLIAEARQSYQGVRDYTCVLIKRERMDGQMQADNLVTMKVRSQPFSVYLGWRAPKDLAGQEACYVAGRNNGQMRVHSTGLLGAVGFVSLDPNDARARKSSHHAITEAGIGNLIERFAGYYETDRRMNLTQVKVGEYEYNKRRCMRVETMHPDNRSGQFRSYRSVLYFDKENHLPIRCEVYDWPRQGGAPEGELMEVYNYVDLKLNVGLGDEAFNY